MTETLTLAARSDITLIIEARDAARSGRAARLRVAAGLTQSDIARAMCPPVSPAAVCRWEHGNRRPDGLRARAYGAVLREIAAALSGTTPAPNDGSRPGGAAPGEERDDGAPAEL